MVTKSEIDAITAGTHQAILQEREAIAKAVGAVIRTERGKLLERIETLERAVAALEASGLKGLADLHRGVWRAGQSYARGELCSHGGGVWLARSDTSGRPGEPGCHWELIVKAARASDPHARHGNGRDHGVLDVRDGIQP